MPSYFLADPKSGEKHIVHLCEACGEYASFGFGGNIRSAMKQGRSELAGKWFCHKHRKDVNDGKSS